MKRKSLFVSVALLCLASIVSVPGSYAAVSETSNRGTCPRYPAGSSLVEPKDLFSSHGILQVSFTYETRVDEYGNVLYCFMTEDGTQSPTLHVRPGDELLVKLRNALSPSTTPSFQKHAMAGMSTSLNSASQGSLMRPLQTAVEWS
jgi:hypothetical protein